MANTCSSRMDTSRPRSIPRSRPCSACPQMELPRPMGSFGSGPCPLLRRRRERIRLKRCSPVAYRNGANTLFVDSFGTATSYPNRTNCRVNAGELKCVNNDDGVTAGLFYIDPQPEALGNLLTSAPIGFNIGTTLVSLQVFT